MTVVLDQITKSFGALKVLHELDLEVNEGEFLVLLGASGSGKSTALRMIAGLESVTGGSISIDGRDVTNELPKNRNVAMVFQSYALYPQRCGRSGPAFRAFGPIPASTVGRAKTASGLGPCDGPPPCGVSDG